MRHPFTPKMEHVVRQSLPQYTIRLTIGDVVSEQTVEIREDPRHDFDPTMRAEWTETLLGVWGTVGAAESLSREVRAMADRLDADLDVNDALEDRLRDMERTTGELSSRLNRLYGSIQGWVGPLAADQEAQRLFLTDKLEELSDRWAELQGDVSG